MKLPLPLFLAIGSTTLLMTVIAMSNQIADRREQSVHQAIAALNDRLNVSITPENATAQRLRKLAADVGICSLVQYPAHTRRRSPCPRSILDHPSPTPGKSPAPSISNQISKYLQAHVQRPDDAIAPPPKVVQDYLATTQPARTAIRNLLLSQEPPHWATHPDWVMPDGDDARISFYGVGGLQNVLLVDALDQRLRGQPQVALQSLEASWRLNQSLRDRPETFAQVTAQESNRAQMGVLRKLGAVPVHWQQRLLEHDEQQSALMTLEVQIASSFLSLQASLSREPEEATYREREATYRERPMSYVQPLTFAGQPLWRMQFVQAFQEQQAWLVAARSAPPCTIPQLPSAVSRGDYRNYLGQERKQLRVALRHRLTAELTQQILQVKATIATTGKPPQSLSDRPSQVCPGSHWAYRVSNGKLLLSLQQKPAWLQDELLKQRSSSTGGKGLPLTYRIQLP